MLRKKKRILAGIHGEAEPPVETPVAPGVKLDKSLKKSVDAPLQTTVDFINSHPDYVSTSVSSVSVFVAHGLRTCVRCTHASRMCVCMLMRRFLYVHVCMMLCVGVDHAHAARLTAFMPPCTVGTLYFQCCSGRVTLYKVGTKNRKGDDSSL